MKFKMKMEERERERGDLREGRTLGPNTAIVADDGSGGEMLALPINVAHQMVIHICLPRHFSLQLFKFPFAFFFFIAIVNNIVVVIIFQITKKLKKKMLLDDKGGNLIATICLFNLFL